VPGTPKLLADAVEILHVRRLVRQQGRWQTHPVRLAYQPPANSTFLSEQISHQQPASRTFLSQQISTSHRPNEHVVLPLFICCI
jgi:hypothetical protein